MSDNLNPAAPETASLEAMPVEPAAQETSTEVTQAAPITEKAAPPAPELSLKDKIANKAKEVAERRAADQKGLQKDPKTGKFVPKTPVTPVTPGAPGAVTPALVDPTKPGETPAFSPNFKYKVMEQEKEIPEIFRSLVKDAETEKTVRELMEKADGLDFVKPKLAETRQERDQFRSGLEGMQGQVNHARQLFSRGDIDGWLKFLQVPEERMLQWVADKLNYNQLPPDQRAILDQRKQAEERAWSAEQQASSSRQTQEQLLTQQVQMQLESVLARPDVSSVAQAFDSRRGANAFRAEMNRRGDYYWRTEGKLVAPDQLAKELLDLLGPTSTPAAPAPTAAAPGVTAPAQAPAAPATPPVVSQKQTPVIPNVSGRSAAPIKGTVKSLGDLRAKHKELQDARRLGGR